MKKSICLLILALLSSSFALGQTKYKMVIETNNGFKYDYKTDEIKIITFEVDESGDVYPDYEDNTKVYFAYQNPVRTLVLGNDIYDNTLDNAHKCRIWATMGGAYSGRDGYVDIVVDETLCGNLWFTDDDGNVTTPVLPMPTSYYLLLDNKISYNGEPRGYVEVQFTDAFFNDPKSIERTYVIPILMTNVTGFGGILTGTPHEGLNPSRTDLDAWDVLAKDYVLYCVKYMNPWQAKYIRRGVDNVTENGNTTTVVRKDTYFGGPVNQNDEVCGISTKNMTQAIFPVAFKTSGTSISCKLILTFNGDQCTISTDDENVTATGSGEFIERGTDMPEYKDYQWGSMDGQPVSRDILRLAYEVKFRDRNVQVSTNDTLVVMTRESNVREFFNYKYVK